MYQHFRRHIALTPEHGSWVFLFSPLLIGLAVVGRWTTASTWLSLAAISVFLFRHPLTFWVKIQAGRRNRSDLPSVYFWMAVYGTLSIAGLIGLVLLNQSWLAVLAIPAFPILGWHLWLVYRRKERRQIGMEIIASGVLALAAPGAYWAGIGNYDPVGWWLWLLTWLQSAGSITYAAMRLQQRSWKEKPGIADRVSTAKRALVYTAFNVLFTFTAGLLGQVSNYLWLAFAIQLLETLWGMLRPAIKARPSAIGLRQLVVSTLFTLVFILLW